MALTNSDLATLVAFKAFCRDDCALSVDLTRFRHDGVYAAHLLAELTKLPQAAAQLRRVRSLASGASSHPAPPPTEKYRGSLR